MGKGQQNIGMARKVKNGWNLWNDAGFCCFSQPSDLIDATQAAPGDVRVHLLSPLFPQVLSSGKHLTPHPPSASASRGSSQMQGHFLMSRIKGDLLKASESSQENSLSAEQ